MKRNLLLLLLCLTTLIGRAQLNWTPIADYPHPSFWPAYFMIGSNLYVCSGLDSLSPVIGVSDLQMYNPGTNSWSQMSSLPNSIELNGSSSFTINGLGYVLNGQVVNGSYSTAVYQYDPNTDSWTTKAPFIGTANYTASSFSIGPYGFLGLGFRPYTSAYYCYNSLTDSWSSIPAFPGQARQGAVSFVINGTGYVGLGGVDNGGVFTNLSDFYAYDTASQAWTAIAPFPDTPRIDCQAFAMNGKGYVVGGQGSVSADLTNYVYEYDPVANTWTQIDTFPIAFRSGVGCSNGSYAIVGLGLDQAQNLMNQLWQTGKPTAIAEINTNQPNIWFYSNAIHIRFQQPLAGNSNFSLYDVSGREVDHSVLQKGESSFDLSFAQLSDGLYLYSIISSSQLSSKYNGKMEVNH